MTGTNSHISVPVQTDQFRALCFFLDSYSSAEDPVEVVSRAIDFWIENAASNHDLLSTRQQGRGYRWKNLFLPDGSEVRFKYRNEYHYAKVDGDLFIWKGEPSSPSQFANEIATSVRNAWRDLEVKRPGDLQWRLADALRRGKD